MSAHDWPDFESREDNPLYPTNRWIMWNGQRVGHALITEEQYNYAKVRIDACAGLPDEAISGVMKGTAHNYAAFKRIEAERDALQQRCEELVDIAHECQKIIKELCACYSHHEPIATLERIEAIKQVQP